MVNQTSSHLEEFNRHVLEIQDGAFTFACDLLGDEAAAAIITQRAITQVFKLGRTDRSSIRKGVLRYIADNYTRSRAASNLLQGLQLSKLSEFNRLVLLLVDHLSLPYADVAKILRCSPSKVCRQLALARSKIANCDRIKMREPHAENTYPGGRR